MKNDILYNKKARYNYYIEKTIEAGLVLNGSEVKSIRLKQVNMDNSYADIINKEAFIFSFYIKKYAHEKHPNHDPSKTRKLLLHKAEIKKLLGLIKIKGYTLIPLSLYFNKKHIVKISIGVAVGKKKHDKRQCLKEKNWQLNRARLLKRN